MSRSRIAFFALSLIVVTSLVGGGWLADVGDDTGRDSLYKYLSTFTEVLGLVRQAYVEETDMDTLLAAALDGTTDALDPFSLYVPPSEVEAYAHVRDTGSRLSGLTLLKERGIAYVVAVEAGSPADQAGVRPGDVVSVIDGSSTRELPLWEIQKLLAGEPGTRVELELLRLGEEVRATFDLAPFDTPVALLETVEHTDPDGAVRHGTMLRVGRFEAGTAPRVAELLADVRHEASGRLLVDLRNVAGGDPEAAYAVGELFASGELGRLVQRERTLETFGGDAEPAWSGERLVVLVNRGTLGAAEVLASVLRQQLGAELVGERTFGHAGRQEVAQLSNGGHLLFTGAFYTGPDGQPLNESLEPDEAVSFFSRTYEERDTPAYELIYQRGLERLFAAAEPPAEQQAA